MAMYSLLRNNPHPTKNEIDEAIQGLNGKIYNRTRYTTYLRLLRQLVPLYWIPSNFGIVLHVCESCTKYIMNLLKNCIRENFSGTYLQPVEWNH